MKDLTHTYVLSAAMVDTLILGSQFETNQSSTPDSFTEMQRIQSEMKSNNKWKIQQIFPLLTVY